MSILGWLGEWVGEWVGGWVGGWVRVACLRSACVFLALGAAQYVLMHCCPVFLHLPCQAAEAQFQDDFRSAVDREAGFL